MSNAMLIKLIAGTAVGGLGFKIADKCQILVEKNRELEHKTLKHSWIYLTVMVLYSIAGMMMAQNWSEAVYLSLTAIILLVLSIADINHLIIPNSCVLLLLVLRFEGLALQLVTEAPIDVLKEFGSSLIGMAACMLLFAIPGLLGKAVGAGDIKLAGAMGFALGTYNGMLAIAVMGLIFIVSFVIPAIYHMPIQSYLKKAVSMGPAMAFAYYTVLILSRGDRIQGIVSRILN